MQWLPVRKMFYGRSSICESESSKRLLWIWAWVSVYSNGRNTYQNWEGQKGTSKRSRTSQKQLSNIKKQVIHILNLSMETVSVRPVVVPMGGTVCWRHHVAPVPASRRMREVPCEFHATPKTDLIISHVAGTPTRIATNCAKRAIAYRKLKLIYITSRLFFYAD